MKIPVRSAETLLVVLDVDGGGGGGGGGGGSRSSSSSSSRSSSILLEVPSCVKFREYSFFCSTVNDSCSRVRSGYIPPQEVSDDFSYKSIKIKKIKM